MPTRWSRWIVVAALSALLATTGCKSSNSNDEQHTDDPAASQPASRPTDGG